MRLITAIITISCALSCAASCAQEWQPATITRTTDGREWYHDGSRWVEVTRTQCYGGQCQPNGIYYRQVQPQQQQPREWSQPAPQYQPRPSIIPSPSASDAKALLPWREEMERKQKALETELAALKVKCEQCQNKPSQPPVIDYTKIEVDYDALATKIDTPTVNVDSLAAEVIKKLPPVRIEWETLKGEKLTQEKKLGEVIKFKSVEVGVK